MSLEKLPARNVIRLIMAIGLCPIFALSLLFPRNKRLWVFGNKVGFHDNSRYLMEYVADAVPEVQPIWLAITDQAFQDVANSGLKVVKARSLKGWWYALRAGVGVATSGMGDLNRGLIGGMFLVQLWHGIPIKRILLDYEGDVTISKNPSPLGSLLNRLIRAASRFSWSRYQLITATSDIVAQRLASAFGVSSRRVLVTGTPRVDILLGNAESTVEAARQLRQEHFSSVRHDNLIVLYAPTWREDADEDCLWESFVAEEINQQLTCLNATLVVKLHPYNDFTIYKELEEKNLERIITLRAHVDIHVLMRLCDILITDYSGTMADFSIFQRPILFFTPDLSKYQGDRNFYEPLEELMRGKQCTTWPEVIAQMERTITASEDSNMASLEMCRKFYHYRDAKNCERITGAILERIGKI